jgi:hypothetical protein
LPNYGQNAYFLIFFEIIKASVVLVVCRYPKKKLNKKNLKKNGENMLIIQNLDVVNLELGVKVKFANL